MCPIVTSAMSGELSATTMNGTNGRAPRGKWSGRLRGQNYSVTVPQRGGALGCSSSIDSTSRNSCEGPLPAAVQMLQLTLLRCLWHSSEDPPPALWSTPAGSSLRYAASLGFEDSGKLCKIAARDAARAQIDAQAFVALCREVAEVVHQWPVLSNDMRKGVLALIRRGCC